MKNVNYKIIMPTTQKYLDISLNFIELLKRNWPESIQNVVLSVSGTFNSRNPLFNQVKIFENPDETSLPNCVYNASKKYKADLYLVFLGDAFIAKRVDTNKINNLLNRLIDNKIQYCRLLPQIYLKKSGNDNNLFRYIRTDERYSHSFVAFAATNSFISSEFSTEETDRDFEIKYLKLVISNDNHIYKDRAILIKNIFHILPSIQKGKWDLFNYFYLKRKYPDIEFSNEREKISLGFELVLYARKFSLPFTSNRFRIKIKQLLSKTGYFDTKI
ncbi:hypothetical protein HCY88_09585 [Limosilactobacillus fermentum]